MVNIVLSIEIGYFTSYVMLFSPYTNMIGRTFGSDETPFKASFTETPVIPRKPAKPESTIANGHEPNGHSNGNGAVEVPQGHKRALSGGDGQPAKKVRLSEPSATTADDDDVVIVDDAGGAIVIDD